MPGRGFEVRGAYDFETQKWKINSAVLPFFVGAVTEAGDIFSVDGRSNSGNICDAFLEYAFDSNCCDWWAHNGGKFDILFLVEAAKRLKYDQSGTCRSDGRVIHWVIKHRDKAVHFRDTQALVPGKLAKIAEAFQLESRKLFSSEDYEGDLSTRDYNFVRSGCLADCRMVLELVSKIETLAEHFGAKMGTTTASTAYNILKAKIYPDIVQPHHKDSELRLAAKICKSALRGGRVEIYHHLPPFLIQEFDINSCYPSAMAEDVPWKFSKFVDIENSQDAFENGDDGVFHAIVSVPTSCNIPPLPCIIDDSLFYPVGTWEADFTAVELRYALEFGVSVKISSGVTYTTAAPFAEYIKELYEIKRISTGPKREFSKLALNSSFGKMAQMGAITRIKIHESEASAWEWGDEHATDYQSYGQQLVTMPRPDREVMFISYGERLQPHTHFAVAAYVTAGGRIRMHKGVIQADFPCYGDTDSVHARGPGSITLSDMLGDFKHAQHDFSAKYYAPKLYEMHFTDKASIYRSKGFALEKDTFDKVVKGLPAEQQKIRTLRKQLKADDGQVLFLEKMKLWHGISNKRCPFPDGATRPWSVDELRSGAHLSVRSPAVGLDFGQQ